MGDVPTIPAPDGVDSDAWNAAVAVVRAYCGWHIAPVLTETILVDAQGGSALVLPSLRVTEISEVKIGDTVVESPEWSAAGFVRGCWPKKLRAVSVTWTHGFDEAPLALVAASKRLVEIGSVPAGIRSRATGPYSVTYRDAETIVEQDFYLSTVLSVYKLPPRP